ncbi:hypothetical protein [Bradyrhizobium sp. SZCCHNS2005]|uniref:hypothetical protein n=1 Tax=Bradyrhizobium sp. SZCCHNS2005 TaxID=3057303 RepID=UPI0028E57170|nr:hypothetical protein [Bradyrhizobium sp. SZCCHNS2005]
MVRTVWRQRLLGMLSMQTQGFGALIQEISFWTASVWDAGSTVAAPFRSLGFGAPTSGCWKTPLPRKQSNGRVYPHLVELSAEDQAALQAAQTEFDRLAEQHQAVEELPDEDARFGELENQIEELEAKRQACNPDDVAHGGAFVILNHDGTLGSNGVSSAPRTINLMTKLVRKATLRRPTRRVGRTIELRAIMKKKMEKVTRKRRNKGCPTRSFVTLPHIAPWVCAST